MFWLWSCYRSDEFLISWHFLIRSEASSLERRFPLVDLRRSHDRTTAIYNLDGRWLRIRYILPRNISKMFLEICSLFIFFSDAEFPCIFEERDFIFLLSSCAAQSQCWSWGLRSWCGLSGCLIFLSVVRMSAVTDVFVKFELSHGF